MINHDIIAPVYLNIFILHPNKS